MMEEEKERKHKRNSRRSSILKPRVPLVELDAVEDTEDHINRTTRKKKRQSKRVSFSETKKIKFFEKDLGAHEAEPAYDNVGNRTIRDGMNMDMTLMAENNSPNPLPQFETSPNIEYDSSDTFTNTFAYVQRDQKLDERTTIFEDTCAMDLTCVNNGTSPQFDDTTKIDFEEDLHKASAKSFLRELDQKKPSAKNFLAMLSCGGPKEPVETQDLSQSFNDTKHEKVAQPSFVFQPASNFHAISKEVESSSQNTIEISIPIESATVPREQVGFEDSADSMELSNLLDKTSHDTQLHKESFNSSTGSNCESSGETPSFIAQMKDLKTEDDPNATPKSTNKFTEKEMYDQLQSSIGKSSFDRIDNRRSLGRCKSNLVNDLELSTVTEAEKEVTNDDISYRSISKNRSFNRSLHSKEEVNKSIQLSVGNTSVCATKETKDLEIGSIAEKTKNSATEIVFENVLSKSLTSNVESTQHPEKSGIRIPAFKSPTSDSFLNKISEIKLGQSVLGNQEISISNEDDEQTVSAHYVSSTAESFSNHPNVDPVTINQTVTITPVKSDQMEISQVKTTNIDENLDKTYTQTKGYQHNNTVDRLVSNAVQNAVNTIEEYIPVKSNQMEISPVAITNVSGNLNETYIQEHRCNNTVDGLVSNAVQNTIKPVEKYIPELPDSTTCDVVESVETDTDKDEEDKNKTYVTHTEENVPLSNNTFCIPELNKTYQVDENTTTALTKEDKKKRKDRRGTYTISKVEETIMGSSSGENWLDDDTEIIRSELQLKNPIAYSSILPPPTNNDYKLLSDDDTVEPKVTGEATVEIKQSNKTLNNDVEDLNLTAQPKLNTLESQQASTTINIEHINTVENQRASVINDEQQMLNNEELKQEDAAINVFKDDVTAAATDNESKMETTETTFTHIEFSRTKFDMSTSWLSKEIKDMAGGQSLSERVKMRRSKESIELERSLMNSIREVNTALQRTKFEAEESSPVIIKELGSQRKAATLPIPEVPAHSVEPESEKSSQGSEVSSSQGSEVSSSQGSEVSSDILSSAPKRRRRSLRLVEKSTPVKKPPVAANTPNESSIGLKHTPSKIPITPKRVSILSKSVHRTPQSAAKKNVTTTPNKLPSGKKVKSKQTTPVSTRKIRQSKRRQSPDDIQDTAPARVEEEEDMSAFVSRPKIPREITTTNEHEKISESVEINKSLTGNPVPETPTGKIADKESTSPAVFEPEQLSNRDKNKTINLSSMNFSEVADKVTTPTPASIYEEDAFVSRPKIPRDEPAIPVESTPLVPKVPQRSLQRTPIASTREPTEDKPQLDTPSETTLIISTTKEISGTQEIIKLLTTNKSTSLWEIDEITTCSCLVTFVNYKYHKLHVQFNATNIEEISLINSCPIPECFWTVRERYLMKMLDEAINSEKLKSVFRKSCDLLDLFTKVSSIALAWKPLGLDIYHSFYEYLGDVELLVNKAKISFIVAKDGQETCFNLWLKYDPTDEKPQVEMYLEHKIAYVLLPHVLTNVSFDNLKEKYPVKDLIGRVQSYLKTIEDSPDPTLPLPVHSYQSSITLPILSIY